MSMQGTRKRIGGRFMRVFIDEAVNLADENTLSFFELPSCQSLGDFIHVRDISSGVRRDDSIANTCQRDPQSLCIFAQSILRPAPLDHDRSLVSPYSKQQALLLGRKVASFRRGDENAAVVTYAEVGNGNAQRLLSYRIRDRRARIVSVGN